MITTETQRHREEEIKALCLRVSVVKQIRNYKF